VLSELCQYR